MKSVQKQIDTENSNIVKGVIEKVKQGDYRGVPLAKRAKENPYKIKVPEGKEMRASIKEAIYELANIPHLNKVQSDFVETWGKAKKLPFRTIRAIKDILDNTNDLGELAGKLAEIQSNTSKNIRIEELLDEIGGLNGNR